MKKIILLFLLVFILSLYKVSAVPAVSVVHTLKQDDGTEFQAIMWGDEWQHGWETIEGYTIVYDDTSKNWVYAIKDSRGSLVPSGSIVGKDPPPSGVTKHLRPSPRMQPPGVRVSGVVGVLSAPPPPSKVVPPTGTANIPVILINFNDTTTTYNSSDFNTLIFGSGTNSMKDYYEEVSYGTFSISPGPSGVVGWYTAAYSHNYYGQNDAYGRDMWPGDLVYEAVAAADPLVDFSAYDSDGNCIVDVVAIVHQGTGEETGAGSPTDIWSHRWTLYGAWYYGYSHYPLYNTSDSDTSCPAGYVINDYIIMPELYNSTTISTIGVFTHEYGHAFGLPDLYDTDYSSEGIGRWGLMGSGNWLGSPPGSSPAHMSAWSKYYLGWVNPVKVTASLFNEPINQSETYDDVYMLLDNPGDSPGNLDWTRYGNGTGEYFLIENRRKTGFDAYLPGEGLLIWHIDESQEDNTNESNYLVALEQADGLFDLENDINRGDAGDPWYNSVIGFTEATIPNSNLYNGSLSGVRVTNISQSATIMTANLIVGWPPPTITFVSPTPSNNSVINVSYVYINITASEPLNTAILNWNGVNETMQGSGTNWHLNKTGLADGSYTFKVYGNDTAGNMNVSEIRVVTISTGGVNQIDSCQVISSPGVYVLTQDILNSSATKCIEITSSDVIFDGNGHTIDGLDTSNTYGVYVYNFSTLTNVTVKNLTVTDWYYGIYYQNTENGAIEDNNATSNYYGIFLFSSNYNTITNNTANSNDNHGIFLSSSSNYNTLSNNTAASNTYGGIYLWSSSNINTLSNNNATSNYYGIYLYSSTNNTLSNNSITSNSYGIRFYSSSNNTISDNLVSSNIYGAYLWSSNYNTLSNNNATSNSYGIYLYSSSHNTLSNNNVTSNSQQGIYLYYSSNYNTLSNNNATSNYYGIYLYSSSNYNTLSNNNATSNSYGIYLSSSNYNTITNNTANSNNNYGIYLSSSSNNNVVDNNNATSNYYGIYLYSSSNYNTITNNTVISNNFYGIYLSSSSNNLIYNNLFNNTNNFFISASYNTWNVAKQAGTNIVGGPYLGGNYWAKPDGTGFSETCDDLDADGICDSPYSLTTGNIDYLPLTAPPHVLGPEIDSCGVIASSGYYNLTMDILDSGDSSCIKIVSNNVTLDGAGHSIDGIDTSGTYGVYVSNSTITLTNITVKNLVVTDWSYGIYYKNTENGTIYNNNATSNSYGIYLYSSSHNTLSNNNVTSNSQQGIYLYYSSNYNTLSNNNATSNYYGIYLYSSSNYNTLSNNNATSNSYGIYLSSSNYNTITNNTANSNNNYGIYLSSSSNNTLSNNNATSNTYGIHLYSSTNNTLTSNTATSNTRGIFLSSSSNYNTLSNNNPSSNTYGICLSFSTNNTLSNNNATSNTYGIYLYSSGYNFFYNNFFNNTINFYFGGTTYSNTWNVTKQAGINIIGGPYLGGNYWARLDGSGYSQTCTDTDADGICDSPYTLITNNIDYLPLTTPPTPDTTPPNVTIIYPVNTTYNQNVTYINVSVTDDTGVDTVLAEIDSSYNVTLIPSGDYYINNTINLGNGNHWIRIYANDTSGNMNSSEVVYFSVDTVPPTITFVSPTPSNNSVINVSYVYINITASEPLNTAILNWNGVNETMQGSGTNWHLNKTGLADGSYTFKVYGNDTAGNMNVSEIRVVTISTGGVNQIDSCQVISSPGVYVLTQDILNSSATKCIEITSSDVIFDGNGHTIDGLDTSNTYGVYVYNFSTLTNVTVKNLTVTDWYYGIYYLNAQNGFVENNTATNNTYGIYLYSSTNNTLTNNTATLNGDGISLANYSNNNTIANNNATSNYYGIYLRYSSNNTLARNIVSSNTNDGILLWMHSNSNTIVNNIVASNKYGIHPDYSDYNTIENNTVISNTYYGIYLDLSCDNNTVVKNIVTSNYYGIYLYSSSNYNTIANNNATLNGVGIYLDYSSHNTISNNNALNNSYSGIHLGGSYHNNIIGNNVTLNGGNGIFLSSSYYNNLTNNIASSNNLGIHLYESGNNTITNNSAALNIWDGVYLEYSSNNTLVDNTFLNNNLGVYVEESTNNTLTSNNISFNYYGIYFYYPGNNTIVNNTIMSNTGYGIYLDDSGYNLIYNNYLNNTNNTGFTGTIYFNTWNTSKTLATNIINGPYLGGNYWASPSGHGFSETCTDADADGICDSPYTLTTNNIDYLPLTIPILDTTPPNVTIISPQNTTYNTTSIQINVSATDPSGIDTVIAQVDGTTNITLTLSNNYYVGNVILPYGNHWIRIYANDTIGNMNSSQVVYFFVNATPPAITFVPPTPANNSIINITYVNVSVTSSRSLTTAVLNWNGTNYTMLGSGLNWSYNVTGLADGSYSYLVLGQDLSGMWNRTEVRYVTVDTHPPSITITFPENNTIIGQIFNFTYGSIQDINDLIATLFLNGTPVYTWTDRGYFWRALNYSIGWSWINITAVDEAYNSNTTSIHVNVTRSEINQSVNITAHNATTIDGRSETGVVIEITTNKDVNPQINITATTNPGAFNASSVGANDVGLYFSINASNINKSDILHVLIKVYYDESMLDKNHNGALNDSVDINESSLRLYRLTNGSWVRLDCGGSCPINLSDGTVLYGAGVNTSENYVWANLSGLSVYGVGGEGEKAITPVVVHILPFMTPSKYFRAEQEGLRQRVSVNSTATFGIWLKNLDDEPNTIQLEYNLDPLTLGNVDVDVPESIILDTLEEKEIDVIVRAMERGSYIIHFTVTSQGAQHITYEFVFVVDAY